MAGKNFDKFTLLTANLRGGQHHLKPHTWVKILQGLTNTCTAVLFISEFRLDKEFSWEACRYTALHNGFDIVTNHNTVHGALKNGHGHTGIRRATAALVLNLQICSDVRERQSGTWGEYATACVDTEEHKEVYLTA